VAAFNQGLKEIGHIDGQNFGVVIGHFGSDTLSITCDLQFPSIMAVMSSAQLGLKVATPRRIP